MAAKKKKTTTKTAPKKSPASKKKASPAKAKRVAPKKTVPKKKKAAAKKAAPKRKKAAAKKAAPKRKKAAAKKAAPKAVARRDATGHLAPKYARDLLSRSRESRDDTQSDRAFLKKSRSRDDLAEELGEEAVATMTSGEDQSDRLEAVVDEERGGPFVRTRAGQEFATGTDKSNPRSATREPYPKT